MGGIFVLGAGGHAKVVADILQICGFKVGGFLDDNRSIWNTRPLGIPVLGPIDQATELECDGLIVGIGSNRTRRSIVQRLGTKADDLWLNAIHPSAVLAASVTLGRGVVITANAVLNPDVVVGDHVIVNTAATIDHDCQLSDFSHVAPGGHLCGGTKVGTGVLLGAGTITIPGVQIGRWSTLGAGSTVIHDIPENVVAVGSPARWKETENADHNVFS